jgi:hypothetical protein
VARPAPTTDTGATTTGFRPVTISN